MLTMARRLLRGPARDAAAGPNPVSTMLVSTPTIFWTAGPDGKIDYLSEQFTRATGMDAMEAVRDDRWKQLVCPADLPSLEAQWVSARTTASESRSYFRLQQRDGSYRWMQAIGRPVLSPKDGTTQRWVGGLSDVDAELRARPTAQDIAPEAAGGASSPDQEYSARVRWRYRSLFHDPTIGVIEFDLAGVSARIAALRAAGVVSLPRFLDAHPEEALRLIEAARPVDLNPTMIAMLGLPQEDPLRGAPSGNRHNCLVPRRRMVEAMFAGERRVTGVAELIRLDGERLVVAYAINLSEDNTAYSTLVDITPQHDAAELRFAAQEQLARASKASTVGAISISIAHELNQPLTSMRIELRALERLAAMPGKSAESLQPALARVTRQCERLAGIIERTRDRVLANQPELGMVSLSDVVRQMPELLQHELATHQVAMHLNVPDGLVVRGDAHDLQQLFVNLAMNAMEAMVEVPPQRRAIWLDLVRLDTWVRVRVSDSGPGIDPAIWPMIFEPFFTTKPDGLGMGLRICRTIVETLGGDLQVCRREGGGTVFEFCVPLPMAA
ncbi:ATP-binding protein [Sphingomonas sp. TDK1]|uniref:ATP-binding protein n=1 Tax=Sphingomonas sp. TDK1 TaxID=453247 RepID=UPI0007D94485|nr:ATP-binding protein [Sphingomonas sp. TDK1]OAN66591.1 hypothetical protein A7X12_10685 [Sphingomonas sp. TDK1]